MAEFNGVPVKPGDKVTVECVVSGDVLDVMPAGLQWRITAHEPKVELPTEPGWYRSAEGAILFRQPRGVDESHHWQVYVLNSYQNDATVADEYAPLTRLRPEIAVAADVANWLESGYGALHSGNKASADAVRRKFGVL